MILSNPPNLAENVGKYVITPIKSFYTPKCPKVPRKVKKILFLNLKSNPPKLAKNVGKYVICYLVLLYPKMSKSVKETKKKDNFKIFSQIILQNCQKMWENMSKTAQKSR